MLRHMPARLRVRRRACPGRGRTVAPMGAGGHGDDELFAMTAVERRALADDLAALSPEQWAAQSLCAEWTVRDVAGHLTAAFLVSVPTLMLRIAKNLGNFNKAMSQVAKELGARPTDEIVATIRENAEHRFTPPGNGPEAPLTDWIVHGQDIRRPLGLHRDFPVDALSVALQSTHAGLKGFVPKGRVAGLRYRATDLDWSGGPGDGAALEGQAEAVLLAICGRPVALDDLTGDGVAVLRARLR